MICFVVGCDPVKEESQLQFLRMLDEVQVYDGLEQILMNPDTPWKAVLCFDSQEHATAAQWMLSLNGAEGRERTWAEDTEIAAEEGESG